MAKRRSERRYRASDGSEWRIEVRLPGASNAMVVFHNPGTPLASRYSWHMWRGPEARSVTSRVAADRVMESLADEDLAQLFRRSIPIAADRSMVGLAAGV